MEGLRHRRAGVRVTHTQTNIFGGVWLCHSVSGAIGYTRSPISHAVFEIASTLVLPRFLLVFRAFLFSETFAFFTMREEVNASSLSPLALLEEALLLMLPPDHVSRIEWREPTHHSIENHFSRYRDLISRLVAGRFEHCVFEDLKLSKVCSTEVLKDLSADFCEQSPRKVSSRLIEWNDLPPVWNSINSWISERRGFPWVSFPSLLFFFNFIYIYIYKRT